MKNHHTFNHIGAGGSSSHSKKNHRSKLAEPMRNLVRFLARRAAEEDYRRKTTN